MYFAMLPLKNNESHSSVDDVTIGKVWSVALHRVTSLSPHDDFPSVAAFSGDDGGDLWVADAAVTLHDESWKNKTRT